MLNW
jgi:hypothetical protein